MRIDGYMTQLTSSQEWSRRPNNSMIGSPKPTCFIYLSIFLSIYLYIYIYVYVCASLATKHVIRIHPCICNLKTCNVWSVPDQGRTCHRHKMYNTWHRKKIWKTNRRFGAQWSSNSFNLLYPTRITMSHIQFAAKNHLPTLSEAVQYTKRPRCLHWRSR